MCRALFSRRSQRTLKYGKNVSDTLGYRPVCDFLFLPHFDVICDLFLNRRTATWNLLNRNTVLNQSARVFALGYFLKRDTGNRTKPY